MWIINRILSWLGLRRLVVTPPSQTINGLKVGMPVVGQQSVEGRSMIMWSVVGGSVPPGYLMSASGFWGGRVAVPGVYEARIRAEAENGLFGDATYTWVIEA